MYEIAGQGPVVLTPEQFLTIIYCVVFAVITLILFLAWPSNDE
jgi:hypothetical protein